MPISSNLSEPPGNNDLKGVHLLGNVPPSCNACDNGNAPGSFLNNSFIGNAPHTSNNGNAPNNEGNAPLPHLNIYGDFTRKLEIQK